MSSAIRNLFMPGPVTDGKTFQWPNAPFARTVTELDLFVQGVVPGANVTFQLTLDIGAGPVAQPGVYTILNGHILSENPIAPPLAIPAYAFPGIVVIAGTASGVTNILAWLTTNEPGFSVPTSAETTGLLLAGVPANNKSVQFPRVAYQRLATELDFIAQGAPATGDALFQLTLNGVPQTGVTYILKNGQTKGENAVAVSSSIVAAGFGDASYNDTYVRVDTYNSETHYVGVLHGRHLWFYGGDNLYVISATPPGGSFEYESTNIAVSTDPLGGYVDVGSSPPGGTISLATVGNGLVIPANVFPGVIVINANGASDIVVWLTSQVTLALISNDPWVTPTIADLRTVISDPEYETFTSDFLQLANGDPVPALLAHMVDYFSGFVARGGFSMGLEGTIPRQLLFQCLILTKYRLFDRVVTMKGIADTMKDEVKRIETMLEDKVAKGYFSISTPIVFATQKMQGSGAVTSHGTRRRFTRRGMDGLT